ncbi:MMPL family transporter [Actinophytocola xanthii]|uniref:RND transporter n=1 Tax=Actinophytocola xanthii TaxID=1912961 RepID=A0A1Q8CY10_9PSEU|nr:MMPL family transporter [Actinophytocola xanthii]OLF19246.1 RND transporter [Actinophytocola xanthii]
MAEWLYRIGKAAARHGWRVVAIWVGVFAVAGGGFGLGFGTLANNFDIPGTASSAVIAELERELPDYSGASGLVVIHTDDGGAFTEEQKQAYADLVARARNELPEVANVVDPFAAEAERAQRAAQVEGGKARLEQQAARLGGATNPQLEAQQAQLDVADELLDLAGGIGLVSDDGSVAVVNVAFTVPRLKLSEETKQAVVDFFDGNAVDGVSVDYSTDIAQGVPEVFGVGEAVGLVIACIVLLVMLSTVIAAALPIVTAVVGVGIGVLASLAFSSVVQMASITPVLGVMLGLAVGIDYSLFIVNRHRKQLAHDMDLDESVALANGTAGNAVLFAGSTVIVALLALNITGVGFLGVMGTVGAVCVAVAVLIAVTLTPAILGLIGQRVLGDRARTRLAAKPVSGTAATPMSTLRAVVTILVSVAALLVVALPALSLRLGLPGGASEPVDSTTYRAYELTADAFGEGTNATLLVTADLPAGLDEGRTTLAQLEIARAISEVGEVDAVAPIAVSEDGRLTAFQVKPAEGPNATSTEQLVRDLRAPDVLDGTSLAGTELGVAGQAAINIDISENLADVLPVYLAVVVGLSLLIMIVVFRSILVPLVATGGFVLSLLATYGATVAVFQWGWLGSVFGVSTPGPILSFLPVLLVGILFGLAMDYQLFLATGMREAFVHGSPARLAVAQGFRAGRSVVIAAALIMVSVFGGFVFSDSNIIRSVGFGLAVGVLLDAFVVRLLLMPALMHLLGASAWWLPRWLDRALPNVDVEGAALERRHPVPH